MTSLLLQQRSQEGTLSMSQLSCHQCLNNPTGPYPLDNLKHAFGHAHQGQGRRAQGGRRAAQHQEHRPRDGRRHDTGTSSSSLPSACLDPNWPRTSPPSKTSAPTSTPSTSTPRTRPALSRPTTTAATSPRMSASACCTTAPRPAPV